MSHFYQLVLPPLFPIFRDAFDVPWVALGFIMTLFYTTSAISQTLAGFLVDRIGARRVLLTGLGVLSVAIALAGASASYWTLAGIVVLAGLGNAVFHPSDYALLNAAVSPDRLGRAYSVHSISGSMGWILAPVVVAALTAALDWRGALVLLGGAGLVVTAFLASQRDVITDHRRILDDAGAAPVHPGRAGARLLLSAPVLVAFAYFALLSMSLVGIKTFGVPAMVTLYGVPLTLATSALTAYLAGNAVGVLAGGVVADRARRHDLVAALGIALAAATALVLATAVLPGVLLPPVLAFAGFCMGATQPSRDMLVRAASAGRASGKVFGFVYSGLDLGSSVTPLVFGWLLDRGEPRLIFIAAAALLTATIATVLQVRRLVPARA
jgi:MFS family permease